MRRSKPGIFWSVALGVLLLDAFTKIVAVDRLLPAYLPRPVWGEAVRLTLVYNPGAAFGLHLGPNSRVIFVALTFVALLVLGRLYLDTPLASRGRTLAIALVAGGAVGNLVDRLKTARGVVDFIDLGVGAWRWPTFNVADIAVTSGAALLAYVMWTTDEAPATAPSAERGVPAGVLSDETPGGATS